MTDARRMPERCVEIGLTPLRVADVVAIARGEARVALSRDPAFR
jgi:hypothetical protein